MIITLVASISLRAQELNISVTVITTQSITNTDPKVFKTLENEVKDFLNSTKWTSDEFEIEERIEGNLLITINEEIGTNNFTGDFTFQSIRPVFNSSYKTKLLNYVDEGINFSYIENQPIRNSLDNYFDNLSSVLSFYAIVMIGLDYDSFSKFGGDPYFTIANNLISQLPSTIASSGGWSPATGNSKRGRYWLMENIFSPRLRPLREAMYFYHLKGLDIMFEDVGKGRAVMISALKLIDKANKTYPNSMLVQMFSDSKNDEIVNIFLGNDRAESKQVYDIMVAVDPYRTGKFNQLLK